METERSLSYADYKEHYRLDALEIVPPEDLPAGQRESEQRRLLTIVKILKPQKGDLVLEVGCGSGWLSDMLTEAGASVYACDISRLGVKKAKRLFPKIAFFTAGDIYNLPYIARGGQGGPDGCGKTRAAFDSVVLSEVVEHLEDLDTALEEVSRLLKPGGRLFVSTPYREKLRWHLCIHCNKLTPSNAHIRTFDEKILEDYLKRHGLTAVKWEIVAHKFLELIRLPERSIKVPYIFWRILDRLFNSLSRKGAFIFVVATRQVDSSPR